MSRIGKNPIQVPDGVDVAIEGQLVSVKGRLGELSERLVDDVTVTKEDNVIWVKPVDGAAKAKQMWGMARTKVANLIEGVSQGFKKELTISGVGYRAQMRGGTLVLQLGFSHDVEMPVPDGVKITCPEQTQVIIEGADKQKVGQIAAEIRGYRPPEPYKGKGVRYADEFILRKEGKKK